MRPTENFNREDVIDWLGSDEVRKGEAYIPKVQQLEITEDLITAFVQGTASAPYEVAIAFSLGFDGMSELADAECSCPVGYDCKHVAAVLLAVIAQNKVSDSDAIRKQVLAWATQARLEFTQKRNPKKSNQKPWLTC